MAKFRGVVVCRMRLELKTSMLGAKEKGRLEGTFRAKTDLCWESLQCTEEVCSDAKCTLSGECSIELAL